MTAIFRRHAARRAAELQATPRYVRWMIRLALAVVLTACVGTTTSSTVATSIAPVSSTVATTIAPSTTIEAVSPTVDTGFYEAVFLRLEVVDDTHEVVVVGVNPQGEEREIARLPGAWVAFAPDSPGRYLRPMGAVSTTGLLAMPRGNPGSKSLSERLMMQWEIFDLLRPAAGPVIIDGVRENVDFVNNIPYYEYDPRPGAFWGPGEQFVIPWGPGASGLLSFVEGRTGSVTTVHSPDELVPAWAADGSGVFTSDGRVLHPDGTRTDGATAIREDSCKRQFESGAAISPPSAVGVSLACLAPDDSMIVFNQEDEYFQPSSGVTTPGDDTWVEIDGSFAGWLKVDQ